MPGNNVLVSKKKKEKRKKEKKKHFSVQEMAHFSQNSYKEKGYYPNPHQLHALTTKFRHFFFLQPSGELMCQCALIDTRGLLLRQGALSPVKVEKEERESTKRDMRVSEWERGRVGKEADDYTKGKRAMKRKIPSTLSHPKQHQLIENQPEKEKNKEENSII